ncbi:MAG: creatininase family protein, partial [Phenylobacterium sp.]|uniref:creatininase family protein n=1 Tax=Phenylobacterium sp. TaxID=1871053 RepID=UPI0025DC4DF2
LPGNSPYHMAFPGTISLKAETIQAVYFEAAQSLIHHGFRRFIFLNAHGGNAATTRFIVDRTRYLIANVLDGLLGFTFPLTAMIATAWIVHAPLPPSEAWPGLLSLCVCLHGCALVAASAIQTTATAALALNGLCGIVIALCPIYYPVTHIPRALAPLVEVLPPTLAMSGALAAYAGQGVSLIGLAGLAAWLAAALWAGYGRFPWSDLPAAS